VSEPRAGDAALWAEALTQWQLGDWASLASVQLGRLENAPQRAELAALAACAHMQTGNKHEARCFIATASRWGCRPDFMVRALVASAESNLASYHGQCGRAEKEMALLQSSAAAFGGDGSLAARARKALALATGQPKQSPKRAMDTALPTLVSGV
jgi:hypothetical protein